VKCILLGYSDEKKGYHLLSDGKFIVSRDVIFDETERKSVAEIEILLEILDKQVDKEKIRMHNQPSQQRWFEIDLTSSEHENSSSSLPSSSSQISSESSSSSSSDDDTPPPNTSEERRDFVFINPIFNNGENSDPQTSQHQLPKWVVQLLKDVRPDE
jgi:hypothetical protein